MKSSSSSTLILSAMDLSHFMACKHLTTLDQAGALGVLEIPPVRDPSLAAIQQRGFEFEKEYLQTLKDKGFSISEPENEEGRSSLERTINAMNNGIDIIYQASLKLDEWQGRADFMRKVTIPSRLGNWSYEVIDSKLTTHTRVGTILQLCLYSEMVADIQQVNPEYIHVAIPSENNELLSYRIDDFVAYYRYIKKQLLLATANYDGPETTYPAPCSFCDICNWFERCNARLRADDHLSFVAGLSSAHESELGRHRITTMEALAQLPSPLQFQPQRGTVETFEKLRNQAKLQVQARNTNKSIYELTTLSEGRGFFKLPAPSSGDIFFDLEGDPFVRGGGMEYLFGWIVANQIDKYNKIWALNQSEEKKAFETFIDTAIELWQRFPHMHIYHFAAYEPTAMKRLMGKYGTRENEVDQMLRAGIFVDLHTVTKQAIQAGVETYSLKALEKFHEFERAQELRAAAEKLREVQRKIEAGQTVLESETMAVVEKYNQEDCLSTLKLRDWLESLRTQLEETGQLISRPQPGDGSPSEELDDYQKRIALLIQQLLDGLPVNVEERSKQQQAQWLLANMVDWYRREKKSKWWEFFRLRELSTVEMLEEKSGIGDLTFTGNRIPDKKSVIDEYAFPLQDFEIRRGDDLYNTIDGKKIGEVVQINENENKIRIKKGPSVKEIHPANVFTITIIEDKVKSEAIERIASWVLQNGIDSPGLYRAGRDLLINLPPRSHGDLDLPNDAQHKAVAWMKLLDQGVLPIQGPPGTGKSHTGAIMIVEAIKAGKKVGITALSHKVIIGLMTKVLNAADAMGVPVSAMRRVKEKSDDPDPRIREETDNDGVARALSTGLVNLVGGTSWLWARHEMENSVDVSIVDEAGQLALIDTLAVSQAATNLVLLGDPQQLRQPQQGSHPDGTEVSALQHILSGDQTIHENKGIFLDTTWRMHPSICKFDSELFYESRLNSKPGLEYQRLEGDAEFEGAGLFYRPINHDGCQSSCPPEAEYIQQLIARLTHGTVRYTDKDKRTKVLTTGDIKVISPYNAQVNLLSTLLPNGVQIGTVDKFQGQEAPVIIFSMATSSAADAPRGMEFLYSGNRFNVAVSRARSTFILVASPKLFEPDCKYVEQMRLANAFCRFLEVAR
ncbi:MAG: recombinase RecB [Bacteroidetes bacterium]|nr:MAG: recombinase RecB [Bacteroidota bacterium]